MATTVVKLSMREFLDKRKRLAQDFQSIAKRGLVSGAAACIPILQNATRRASPASLGSPGVGGAVNTGYYLGMWRSTPTLEGARVFNDAPYASVIERGRRKGKFPPPQAIQAWAQRRLRLSRAEAKAAVFVIGRAIARRGLKGRWIMRNSLEAMRQVVRRELKRALEERL